MLASQERIKTREAKKNKQELPKKVPPSQKDKKTQNATRKKQTMRRVNSHDDDGDDEQTPLSVIAGKLRKKRSDENTCRCCNVRYADPNDPRIYDDWVSCTRCSSWLHETCADNFGVFDEQDGYLRKQCM